MAQEFCITTNSHDWQSLYIVIVSLVGTLRLINKPLFALAHKFVKLTPFHIDDLVLEKVESSFFYKAFLFVLDWFASIKVKK